MAKFLVYLGECLQTIRTHGAENRMLACIIFYSRDTQGISELMGQFEK